MTEPHALAYERRGDPEQDTDFDASEHYFASGSRATWTHGVEYHGPHETVADGTNLAVRLHSRALATAGVPVLLTSPEGRVVENGVARPVWEVGLPDDVDREVGALRSTSIGERAVRIVHAVVSDADALERLVLPLSTRDADPEHVAQLLRRTVLYTVWERDRINPAIARVMNAVAECWVPCQQNAQMLRESGVREVYVVPHPYDPASDMAKLTARRAQRVPPGAARKRFYSIGSWQPRKGSRQLLEAFLLAYGPRDDASLTIKTGQWSWPGYPGPEQTIDELLSREDVTAKGWTAPLVAQRVKLITDQLGASQMVRLHYEHNIYVSAGHGEAWCLPAFDAKTAGNRLVHVPYGGTADFDDPDDVRVAYQLGPVDPSYKWEEDAQWAQYDLADLVSALQAAEPPQSYERAAEFEHKFELAAVGEVMRERVIGFVLDDEVAREALEQRYQVPTAGVVLEPSQKPQRPEVVDEPPAADPEPVGRIERVLDAIKRFIWR